jgi:acetyl esterase/lipase
MEEERLINLAIASRISVLNVDYRLAPENPFPVGLNDSYTALKWVWLSFSLPSTGANVHRKGIAHAKDSLKADLAKGLIVGGPSSGGNFAASIAIMARDDPSFPGKITGQLLQIPNVIAHTSLGKWALWCYSCWYSFIIDCRRQICQRDPLS